MKFALHTAGIAALMLTCTFVYGAQPNSDQERFERFVNMVADGYVSDIYNVQNPHAHITYEELLQQPLWKEIIGYFVKEASKLYRAYAIPTEALKALKDKRNDIGRSGSIVGQDIITHLHQFVLTQPPIEFSIPSTPQTASTQPDSPRAQSPDAQSPATPPQSPAAAQQPPAPQMANVPTFDPNKYELEKKDLAGIIRRVLPNNPDMEPEKILARQDFQEAMEESLDIAFGNSNDPTQRRDDAVAELIRHLEISPEEKCNLWQNYVAIKSQPADQSQVPQAPQPPAQPAPAQQASGAIPAAQQVPDAQQPSQQQSQSAAASSASSSQQSVPLVMPSLSPEEHARAIDQIAHTIATQYCPPGTMTAQELQRRRGWYICIVNKFDAEFHKSKNVKDAQDATIRYVTEAKRLAQLQRDPDSAGPCPHAANGNANSGIASDAIAQPTVNRFWTKPKIFAAVVCGGALVILGGYLAYRKWQNDTHEDTERAN